VGDLLLRPPCHARVLRVLTEVRDRIHDLAGSREAGSVGEVLVVARIRAQASRELWF
jgi:hypothetical protein